MYILGSENGKKIECSAAVEKKETKFCSKKNLCDCYFDFALKC